MEVECLTIEGRNMSGWYIATGLIDGVLYRMMYDTKPTKKKAKLDLLERWRKDLGGAHVLYEMKGE